MPLFDYHCIINANKKGRGEQTMSVLLTLELQDLPPSVNQMYRTGSRGQRYKKPEVSKWQNAVSKGMSKVWDNPTPYTREVEVSVLFIVNTKKKWDVDNRLKALFDCLQQSGVIENDAQISGILVRRVNGEENRTRIEVREYTGQSF